MNWFPHKVPHQQPLTKSHFSSVVEWLALFSKVLINRVLIGLQWPARHQLF